MKHRDDIIHTAKVILVDVAIILSIVMAFDPVVRDFVLFRPSALRAAGGYAAVDALGQIDPNGNPYYTSNGANNGPNEFGFNQVYSVAIDTVRHWLFVIDGNQRILVYELDSGTNQLVDRVADYVLGKPDFKSTQSGISASLMEYPSGLAVDETGGRLFVSDRGAYRVLVFDIGDGITNGEDAVNVLGQPDFTTADQNGGFPDIWRTTSPQGLVYDASTDRLFVVQSGANRVTVFDIGDGITDGEDAINVLGQSDFTSYIGGTNQFRLSNPTHATLDESGQRLFVGDIFNNRVMVFDVAAITDGEAAVNVLGHVNYTSGSGGINPASLSFASDFNTAGVAYDPGGNRLFVADGGNERVMVFDVATITNGEAAVNVLGQPDFTTNGGSVSQSTFGSRVGGLLYDGDNGFLYVTDEYFHRVMVFDVAAITNGEAAVDQLGYLDAAGDPLYDAADGNLPDNGPNAYGFDFGEGVALDTVNHRLFVTDWGNNRVLVYNLDGSDLLADRVADNVLGQSDFKGHLAGVTSTQIHGPSGIAYDATGNRLFITDQNNNRVLVFDVAIITDGEAAVNVLGQPDFTSNNEEAGEAGMLRPRSVAVDEADGRLFVVDQGNNRVVVFDLSDGITDGENAVNVLGQADFMSTGGDSSATGFSGPYGVTYDAANGRLFVVDAYNDRVQVFDLSGGITDGMSATNTLGAGYSGDGPGLLYLDNVEGTGETQPCQTGGTTLQPAFDDVNNRLFVPDICNHRVMVFDTTTINDGEDAVDVVGQNTFYGTSYALAQDRLHSPQGLAINPANNLLYVADSDNNRVMVFEVPPAPPEQYPSAHEATDVLGQLDGTDLPVFDFGEIDNRPNSRGVIQANGIAVDEAGHRLFVADHQNGRVLVFLLDASNQLQDRVADYVIGQPDFRTLAGGSASDANFFQPYGVAYDPTTGRLFVADPYWNRIMVFDVATITNGEPAINVIGQPDFVTTSAATTQSGLDFPRGVTLDTDGQRLFVYEQINNRVMVFDVAAITDGEPAVNVLGQPDFTTNTAAITQTKLNGPMGGSYDPTDNRLFVGDQGNDRVMVFDVAAITDGEGAVNVLGASDFTSSFGGFSCDAANAGFAWETAYDDANDRLFVLHENHNRIAVYDVATITDGEDAVNVLGQPDLTTCGPSDSQSTFTTPMNLAYDSTAQRLYLAANSRVIVFDVAAITDGEPAVDMIGMLNADDTPYYDAPYYLADDAPNARGFNGPSGIALDAAHHRLFVSEWNNNRILVFNLDASDQPLDYTADYVLGQPNFKSSDAATTQEGLYNPGQIAYDPLHDRLFVADWGNERTLVYDTSVLSDGMAADYVLGQPDFTTAEVNGPTQQDMADVAGVAYDQEAQHLFVTDQGYGRILIFDVSPGTITNYASAIAVLGAPDYTTWGGGTTDSTLQSPNGLAYDPTNHRLFVGDGTNNRVMVFDVAAVTDGEAAVHVLGQDDFTSSDAQTTQSGLSSEGANVFYHDVQQYLYVGDRGNNRVMVFDVAAITDGEPAVDAYGQTTYTGSSAGTSSTELTDPVDMAYDQVNDALLVVDSGNNRILTFGPVPSGGGGGGSEPAETIGFFPSRITINNDEPEVEGYNVLVNIYATFDNDFLGTVDVVLSNTPDFRTTIPFRYRVDGRQARESWPKTVAWDLCFGLGREQCTLGPKTVYARFFVNLPNDAVRPALTPLPAETP